jgi:hypothetical protein
MEKTLVCLSLTCVLVYSCDNDSLKNEPLNGLT